MIKPALLLKSWKLNHYCNAKRLLPPKASTNSSIRKTIKLFQEILITKKRENLLVMTKLKTKEETFSTKLEIFGEKTVSQWVWGRERQ